MSAPRPEGRLRTRRRLLAGISVAVLVLAVLIGLVTGLPGSGADQVATSTSVPSAVTGIQTPQPTPEPDPTPAPDPEPVAPGPTAGGDVLPPVLPAVDLDARAEAGDGVTATVRSIEAIDGSGYGPGNVAGPALRVTVRLENGTDDPVALDGVAVDVTTGAEATPASPLDDVSRAPFSGTVRAGDSADGVYVFTVPADRRDLVTVSVGYRPGAPRMVFAGSV